MREDLQKQAIKLKAANARLKQSIFEKLRYIDTMWQIKMVSGFFKLKK